MKQTETHLDDLIVYEAVSCFAAMAPPSIAKEQIPSFIYCHNFEKAIEKRDRTMERYNQKVSAQQQKVAELDGEIAHLTREIKKRTDGSFLGDMMGKTLRGAKPGMFDNAEEHNKKAAKYNAILEVVRRLEDQCERAIDRRNTAAEKLNESIEEANEKLEQLTAEALLVIDDDTVAVMDKTNKVAQKLSSSGNSEDLLAAVEICFLQLKLDPILEDHIEGNSQRRDFKDSVAEVNRRLAELCARQDVRNHLANLFKRNTLLIAQNRQLNGQILQAISSIDKASIDQPVQSLRRLLGQSFNTTFEYKHLIDPSELSDMVARIRQVIDDLKGHIARVNTAAESAKAPAELGIAAHQTITAMFSEMKNNRAGIANHILHDNHFACEMLNETVIDDFYHRDAKPAVLALREDIVRSVGAEELAALVVANPDRYFIKQAETAIEQANLLRLKAELDKVAGHLRSISDLIAGAESDINQIGEVPREQAETFRAKAFTTYTLACVPWIGFGFALSLLSSVKSFEAAFRSSNEIYRQLGSDIIQKNATMKKVSLTLGGVLGVGGLLLFFILGISDSVAVKIGVPGSALALYLATTAVFGRVQKQIEEYGSDSGAIASHEEAALAQSN